MFCCDHTIFLISQNLKAAEKLQIDVVIFCITINFDTFLIHCVLKRVFLKLIKMITCGTVTDTILQESIWCSRILTGSNWGRTCNNEKSKTLKILNSKFQLIVNKYFLFLRTEMAARGCFKWRNKRNDYPFILHRKRNKETDIKQNLPYGTEPGIEC